MNKEKIIKRASEILGIAENDESLSSCLEMVLNENYGYELSDEAWAYGLAEAYAFCAGLFEKWTECLAKFNEAKLRGAK